MTNYFSDLQNKTVIVTGGSKGIGKHIACSFAQLGAHVVIIGRSEEALERTLSELKVFQGHHKAIQMDVNDIATMRKKVDDIVDEYGLVDVLVNNAGVNIPRPALEITEEDWDKVLDTNLKSSFFLSQAVAKYMIKQKAGRIINIASQMAFVGYVKRAAYCSSKGGMVQLTKALAVEWAPYHINVNAVAPTFVETEMTAEMFKDEAFQKDVKSRILLGDLPKPKDISGAVLYLASNLSDFVTGETLKVDGGWTAI
ncbi:2-deoxy-D-gluconate 3-dehydrogenase [Pullulanibacillus pueri]|uniref:2-deoxy-D-gluconate 3-dehydrogenase n=1 Tax=Pullulanibacillus pueri TaxID=1437324 RepID=A0A8J3ELT6_9BACL|nr:SDR family NAD(P)-dependent oxidoreductase [Pullulanibacillus pueri]MBM7682125.1 2-deoxy-D-gluconate 3-dehydrogenase [Pullulanibacillus pueri]GGH79877.1 2-deoxy-D-gluconate 3-dehydrogenase [Pullulanibacillus pueri]